MSCSRTTIYLLLLSLFSIEIISLCMNPQKAIYLSYKSLSNKDNMAQLFEQISNKSSIYNLTYADDSNQVLYQVNNFRYKLMYNNHFQREENQDMNKVRVILGPLSIISEMKYQIINQKNNATIYSGQVVARSFFDSSYFTKILAVINGYLEWQPQSVPAFTFSALWKIDVSIPQLSSYQALILQQILSNMVGQNVLNSRIAREVNTPYPMALQKFLNSQKLVSLTNIPYVYKDINFNISHILFSFQFNNQIQGLQVQFLFGLPDADRYQTNCTILPSGFDRKQFGGIQQIFTISSLRFIVQSAAQSGLFSVTLNKQWQVPYFQFYMGDLGNAIPYSDNYDSNIPFIVNCQSNDLNKLGMFPFDESSFYIEVPQTCNLKLNDKQILKVELQMILIVKLIAQKDFITARVAKTSTRNIKYTSIDQNFKVERREVADMIVNAVLNGLIDKKVFGDQFPILQRKYPTLLIQNNYLLLFDGSEIYY